MSQWWVLVLKALGEGPEHDATREDKEAWRFRNVGGHVLPQAFINLAGAPVSKFLKLVFPFSRCSPNAGLGKSKREVIVVAGRGVTG